MEEKCEVCYKIVCRGCGWEPSLEEVVLIQAEKLKQCPICSWSPSGASRLPSSINRE